MAKKNQSDYGWIVDMDHPIKPKINKSFWLDLALGAGMTLIGILYTGFTAFTHGAHALQDDEWRILEETGHIQRADENTQASVDDTDPTTE